MTIKLTGALALALAGAAGFAHADPLRFTVAEYSSKTGPYFQAAAEAFMAENDGAEVQVEIVPWDVLLQKLTTDISAGVNADLSIIGTRWLIDFVQEDLIVPMDDQLTGEFKERFIGSTLSPSVIDGQTYALPVAASARAMYYNKDLLEQAGVEVPTTWEELVTVAKAVSELGDDIAGFGLQGKEIETDVYFYYALWSYGGSLIDEDGTSGLDSEAAYQAAETYRELIESGATQPGVTSFSREDVQNLFKQGKVGMMMTAPFLSNQIREEAPDLNYGVAEIPAGPTGITSTYGVTDSIVLFANSDNQNLAWQFLDFLYTPERRAEFTGGEGFLPVLKEVAAMPAFADDADLKIFSELLGEARFAPLVPGWEEMAGITSDALQTIYLGDAEIRPTLDAAAEEITDLLNDN